RRRGRRPGDDRRRRAGRGLDGRGDAQPGAGRCRRIRRLLRIAVGDDQGPPGRDRPVCRVTTAERRKAREENPLRAGLRAGGATTPTAFVIFGATGDLAQRKLLPAIYNLAVRGLLPPRFALVGYARTEMTDEQFR